MRLPLLPLILTTVGLQGCGASLELSPFEHEIYSDGRTVAHLVYLDEFLAACDGLQIINVEDYLAEQGVEVRGHEGGEYIIGSDLLAACGPDCSSEEGLGTVLQYFTVYR